VNGSAAAGERHRSPRSGWHLAVQKSGPRNVQAKPAASAQASAQLGASLTLGQPEAAMPDDPEPAAPFQIANMVGMGPWSLRFRGRPGSKANARCFRSLDGYGSLRTSPLLA